MWGLGRVNCFKDGILSTLRWLELDAASVLAGALFLLLPLGPFAAVLLLYFAAAIITTRSSTTTTTTRRRRRTTRTTRTTRQQ